ncbi:MAG: hypothetical protein ABEL97_12915 [Salinibacter sp.]
MLSSYARWLRYAAYTLLITGVVVGGYYFVYVQERAEQLAEDRLALLQESAQYFEDEIGRVQVNIENTLRDPTKLASAATLDSALRQISGVTHAVVDGWSEPRCLRTARRYGTPSAAEPRLSAVLDPAVRHPHLTFRLREADGGTCPLAQVNPDSLLIPLLPDRESAFDHLLLTRGDGTVLLHSGSGALSIVELPLGDAEPPTRDATDDSSGTDGLYSQIFTMEAAGSAHRVFLHPVRVPVRISGPDGRVAETGRKQNELLFLAGTVQEQALRAEARTLPPTLLYVLLGGLVLTLLAFPFLEVALIGPTEPFRAHDLLELAVGLVVASSIGTLAVFSALCTHQRTQAQFQRLEQVSEGLRQALRAELTAANEQLKRLTALARRCQQCARRTNVLADSAVASALRYPHFEMASWIDRDARQVAKWSVEPQTTPLVDLSDRGYIRAHPPALRDAPPRPDPGQVWAYTEDDSVRWVLESIRSKNTGEVFAQISNRPAAPLKFGRDTAVVAAATLPLLSLIDPVLPPGHQFAVIDGSGRTLFHSDPRRNLRENLFDTIVGGDPLRDAVLARRADRTTAQYRGQSYQFYAHPIADSPWTLLVFAELEPVRALQGHILTSGIGIYGGYLLVLLIGLGLWMGLNRHVGASLRRLLHALWPDRRRRAAYQRLLTIEGGLTALSVVLLGMSLWSDESIGVHIGVAVLGLGALLFFCQYCGGEPVPDAVPTEGPGADWTRSYQGSLLLLIVNIGVLPVAISYVSLHDEGAELLAKRTQRMFAEQLQERATARIEQSRDLRLNASARAALSAALFPEGAWARGRPWDVHAGPGVLRVDAAETCVGRGRTGEGPDAAQPINKTLSQYQITDAVTQWGQNLHVFSHATSSDGAWRWSASETGTRLHFCLPSARTAGLPPAGHAATDDAALRVSSPVPTVAGLMTRDRWAGPLLIGTVALLLGGLWWAVRRLSARVFFLPLATAAGTGPPPTDAADGGTDGTRPTLTIRGRPDPDDEGARAIDASQLDPKDGDEALVQAAEEAENRVLIEHFHRALDTAEGVQAKRRLLERLLALDMPVDVYSDIDPLPYLRTQFGEDDSLSTGPVDFHAWATVLRSFEKRVGAQGPSADCVESLTARRASGGEDGAAVTPAFELLCRECCADAHLRARAGQLVERVAGHPEFDAFSEEQIVAKVEHHARPHYQHLWMTCTDEEKVVLYRCCVDGFVSPAARPVAEQLLRRGLLVQDPVLRPMNESLRRYVAYLDSPVVDQYEEEMTRMTWSQVRTPLLLALAMGMGFVFATQPVAAKKWIAALAPVLAAGLPALINLGAGFFPGDATNEIAPRT